jgi:hypothetical protein
MRCPWFDFFWYDENREHIAQHGVTPDEFEYVVCHPKITGESDSSGNPLVKGYTAEGRWLICIYEVIDDVSVLPITAYEPADE